MQQNPMTVITEILPDKLKELEDYLGPIGTDIKNNPVIKFADYQYLHYCTFFVIPGDHPSPGSSPTPALLAFEANIDGTAKQFVNDLIAKNPEFVNKVYGCCAGYPGNDAGQLASFLLTNDHGANAFYVAHPGQTRDTVYRQRDIRQQIETYIDANRDSLATQDPAAIHAAIVQQLGNIPKPENRPFLTLYGDKLFTGLLWTLGLVLVGGFFGFFGPFVEFLVVLALVAAVVYLLALRWHEMRDKQDDTPWVKTKEREAIQRVEDRQLQNHLTSVIEIKPGAFRFYTLKIVLAAINLVAKLVATKGNLSGIVTIHFARWVILPGNAGGRRRLLFMSNYDGSWENYLGEFIDHASLGLTAVWSSTQQAKDRGFPDTQWLAIKGGSRDEQRFKNFARNSQLPELVWYSAYTDLSVKNIENNRHIHEGLFSTADLAAWLKCL
ncbi:MULTISPECIES: hypothetical protein [Methylomonas]|uniref:Peroxidase n=2 Tax=Methylomonas TaxID=416 RepID=A0A126T228_9GAMM|nr:MULTISPECIES: hypothetical protein [Methylomonas]AMK76140.1 hypothetical protein JT25_006485 [Methylomonas denitrificans]OAH96075.1 hypothetical protein A1342_14225 [Methylomonas methanica]TCV81363.1 hypothetical protein EDE11_11564 [Methylomonas methanica]